MASQLLEHVYRSVVKTESYIGNAAAGQFLVQRVFKPGARYQWNEMLKQATGEELNPEHFIRQFVV